MIGKAITPATRQRVKRCVRIVRVNGSRAAGIRHGPIFRLLAGEVDLCIFLAQAMIDSRKDLRHYELHAQSKFNKC